MSQYMRENTEKILRDLRESEETHKVMYKRYKRCHRILQALQFVSSMISIGCYSSGIATVATPPIMTTFSIIGMAASGINICCTKLDQNKTKKIHKHQHDLFLTRDTINILIKEGLSDDNLTPSEYDRIISIADRYYKKFHNIDIFPTINES